MRMKSNKLIKSLAGLKVKIAHTETKEEPRVEKYQYTVPVVLV
jgi:hypothetical protein